MGMLCTGTQRRKSSFLAIRALGNNLCESSPMAEGDPVRIIPHRGIDDDCGSLEVWFADGRVSVRFYWDNLVSRRLNSGTLTREQAVEKATMLARAEMDKLG